MAREAKKCLRYAVNVSHARFYRYLMAGFEVTINGRFSGDRRGANPSSQAQTQPRRLNRL